MKITIILFYISMSLLQEELLPLIGVRFEVCSRVDVRWFVGSSQRTRPSQIDHPGKFLQCCFSVFELIRPGSSMLDGKSLSTAAVGPQLCSSHKWRLDTFHVSLLVLATANIRCELGKIVAHKKVLIWFHMALRAPRGDFWRIDQFFARSCLGPDGSQPSMVQRWNQETPETLAQLLIKSSKILGLLGDFMWFYCDFDFPLFCSNRHFFGMILLRKSKPGPAGRPSTLGAEMTTWLFLEPVIEDQWQPFHGFMNFYDDSLILEWIYYKQKHFSSFVIGFIDI